MSGLDLEGKKNFIITQVKNLHKYEQIQIFKIFRNNEVKYSENKNGVFVNLNYINEVILDKIIVFINFCQKNKVLLEKEISKREQIKKIVESNHSSINILPSESIVDENTNETQTNYEKGIKYQTVEVSPLIENHYQEKNIIIPSL